MEGAENYADVSPTDSPSEAGSFADDYDAHFSGDDNRMETRPEVGNHGAEDGGRERFIPRERFDRVHEELQRRKAWDPVIEQIRQHYGSPEAFANGHLPEEDEADGYDEDDLADPDEDVEEFEDSVPGREGLADEERAMIYGSRQAVLEAQRNNEYLHSQLRELALSNAQAELTEYLPNGVPAGIENMLRVFPVDLIPSAARDIRAAIEQAVKAARADTPDPARIITEYNSRKAADSAIPTPETRGGSPPPTPAGASDAWRQPLSRLLGWSMHRD
jgi:hypothetical protein